MRAGAIALVAGLCLLAACTTDSPPVASRTIGTPATAATTATTTPAATPSGTATADEHTPTPTTAPPKLVVLSGTSIGGRPLGHADLTSVDTMLVKRLGTAKTGQPQLCRADGGRASMAVIDHIWPGLTVRYGSTGAAAVAIAWSVDLDRVPDGFQLAGGLPWRTSFAALEKMPGVRTVTADGVRQAQLTRLRITWSGPVGASSPDRVAGGAEVVCA